MGEHRQPRLGSRLALAFAATAVAAVALVTAIALTAGSSGIDDLVAEQRQRTVDDVVAALALAYERAGGWEDADLLPAHALAAAGGAVLELRTADGEVVPQPDDAADFQRRLGPGGPGGPDDAASTDEPAPTSPDATTPDGPGPTASPTGPGPTASPTGPGPTGSPGGPGPTASPTGPGPSGSPGGPGPTAAPSPQPSEDRTQGGQGPGGDSAGEAARPIGGVGPAVADRGVVAAPAPSESPAVVDRRTAAVAVDGATVGTATLLFVERDVATAEESFRSSLLRTVGLAGALALVVAIGATALVTPWVTRPLRRLTATVRRIAGGDRSVRAADGRGAGEVVALAAAVDRMAADLDTQERLRQALVADVAHELRTPLTILQGQIEALEDGVIEPSSVELGSLHDEVLRLNRLVEDLDAIASARAAGIGLERVPVDLADVAADTVRSLTTVLEAVEVDLDLSPTVVAGDRRRLEQIVRNLLTNAAKFSPPGGRVTVRVTGMGADAVLSVVDDGPGIPADELPHVFDRFWRGRHAGGVAGSGIGLAVVEELTRAHGGAVSAGNAPGRGAVLTVRLPLDAGAADGNGAGRRH